MEKRTTCKFFANGYCMRGEKCRYSHEKTSVAPQISSSTKQLSEARSSPSKGDPRSHTQCYHYNKGHCRNGSNCPYSHVAEQKKIEPDLNPGENHHHDNYTRGFSGALVQYEIGARVSKISLPADFSAVRIDGLPIGSTPEHISSLLSSEGIKIMPSDVRIRQQDGQSNVSADIKVDDPTFARRLCSKLSEESRFKAKYPDMEAFHVSAGLPSGTNAHQIECKKVQCSWYKPSKMAWLNFGSEEIAKRVFAKFNSKSYKVLGQATRCNAPTRGGGGWRNLLAWTLGLTDLPVMTTEKDILAAISSPQNKPRNIELGKPSYEVEGEEASATVMSLLLQAGPIEWSQVNAELDGKRGKAVARFYEESDARAAVNLLHGKPLPFCEVMTLTVQLVSTAKFKVASMIFNAVQTRIRTASQAWTEKHLKFKIYPSAGLRQQYRVLKIEGEVASDVAAAKETLNEILDGVTVTREGKPLWTHALISNGAMFQELKKIQEDHRVVLLRNKRKQELKLYGSEEKCKEVESILTKIINDESQSAHIIELKPGDLRWACSGGYKMIAATLGDNIVTFDIISTPKRILIGGTDKEYETALRMISKRESKHLSESAAANEDCVVCWGLADNPVITKCNHVYCTECFEHSCSAASSAGKDFSINCHGDMGKCKETFSLEELQEILSSKTFEDILEASFSSYIQRHPQLFRYCPKPNCNTIYRVTSTMHFNTCTECCTVVCTSCQQPHEHKTCAEFEDESSGRYEATVKLMQKIGIKSCPKCKTSIEKTDGCNHISCRCGAHLCWVCLEVFQSSDRCYDHMKEKHGGIGLGYLEHFQN